MIPQHFHYFSKNINTEVKEVYWFAAINALALALTYIFEPIYLFQLGHSVIKIMWFYAMVYAFYCLFVFFAAKITSRIGYKHSILIASLMLVLYWIVLYQIKYVPNLFYIAPMLFALQKSFFWPPYNSDIALNSQKKQRGREVGFLLSVIEVCSIAGPLLGGLISYTFGYKALFATAAILLVGAVYPLFRTPDIYAQHKFEFINLVKIFNKYKINFIGYWGYAEDLLLMSLWPLFIFSAVPFVIGVGGIATFAGITAAVLMLYIGKVTDRLEKHKVIRLTSFIYGLTWVFRFLAQNIPSIMLFDVLTKTGKAAVNVPMVSLTYDLAGRKNADHAIAYSVFYEFSLSVGKIVTALLAILILSYTNNFYLVFAAVGFMTMLYGLLKK